MERVAAIDFFAVRTELLTQHRRASRGGDHTDYADNHNHDVTLKFGGAGDGEVQGKAVVVWRGEGRKRTGEQGRACRALRGDRGPSATVSRCVRVFDRVKFWYADLGVSQSRGTVARARAGSR